MHTTRRSALKAVLSGSAFGLFAGSAVAAKEDDKPTRTVKGIVTDEAERPLEAVVQLKNTRTLDVKSYHTDARTGSFYFAGLDPNIDYEIRAIADGMRDRTRRVSSFESRMELFYEFKLKAQ